MSFLLTADCGNTRAHLALLELAEIPPVPTGEPDADNPWPGVSGAMRHLLSVPNDQGREGIDHEWKQAAAGDVHLDAVVIGSVYPLGDQVVADWATSSPHVKGPPPRVCHLRVDRPIPIVNRTAKPEQVGADRLLNALACKYRFPGRNAIVIDFGTAITFDIVSAAGEYLGGVIAPGLNLALRALHERTALLPLVHATRRPPVIGTDTESAILSGVYYGFPGLVNAVLQKVAATFDDPPLVIATGGDADSLIDELPAGTFDLIVPEITHDGIALAWLLPG